MHPDFELDRRRSRRGVHCALSLVAVAVVALAFAGVGAAAPTGSADLSIVKGDSPDPVTVGSPLTYALAVANAGPDAATGVTVTDQLPKGVDFVSAIASSGRCSQKGRKVTCDLGVLPAASVSYGIAPTVTVTVVPRQLGTIVNTASIKAKQKDPVAANNKASAATSVVGAAVTCRGFAATLAGTAAADTLVGTGGRDVIVGLGGNDTIVSLAGGDLVCAGSGDDYVGAGSAADRVFGGSGSDRLLGRGGPDLLKGGAGHDLLKGNRGGDRLRGGRGIDRCRGGAGVDSIRGCER